MIITYRGWHRNKGENRIVHAPIAKHSFRVASPSEPYPRHEHRAVSFLDRYCEVTQGIQQYMVHHSLVRGLGFDISDRSVIDIPGLTIRVKGSVTSNAEHEVDVFLSDNEIYRLFLQAFGNRRISRFMIQAIEDDGCGSADFDRSSLPVEDNADD